MPVVRFENNDYIGSQGESVLDCLLRHGVNIPHSCKSGACQTCVMRAARGQPSAASQNCLKEARRLQGYFLACSCIPDADIEVLLPDYVNQESVSARVENKKMINRSVVQLFLKPKVRFPFHAGQFVNLYKEASLARSYSIASMTHSNLLELNIAVIPHGQVSTWVHEELQIGDEINISRPLGDCFYTKGDLNQSLLLIATGTGLAPIIGVLRDALSANHIGDIWLYHGSRTADGLYYKHELNQYQSNYANVHYFPCISGEATQAEFLRGRAHEIALDQHKSLKTWRVFLCGNAGMVKQAKKRCYLAGASLNDISSDSFLHS